MGIELGYFIGAVVLLGALVYAVISYSRRNPANEPVTNEATKALYKNEDAYGDKEDEFRAKTRS